MTQTPLQNMTSHGATCSSVSHRKRTRKNRPICTALALAFSSGLCPSFCAASDAGDLAAGLVAQSSYRHYLDDMLYTHDGDDRGFGPQHDLAQTNIASILRGFGLEVTLEPVSYYGNTYYNVVATKWGTTYPDQEYVLGAHYDSVNNPGADDDASGVALVLEAARVLSGFDAEYTIRFVAFDREEQGLWGSDQYVDDHMTDDILAMIAADMVAFNTGADSATVECVWDATPLMLDLEDSVLGYGDGLSCETTNSTCCSDHMSFSYMGFPACLLIENWGNPNYHTLADSVDTSNYIDYAYATKMTRAVVGFLVDHAGVDVYPIDADYNGDGFVDQLDYDVLESCFTGAGVPTSEPQCLFFDFNGDLDIDCSDAAQFATAWTASGSAPTPWPCALEAPSTQPDGGRCLTVSPAPHAIPMAIRISGHPDDPTMSCLSQYVQADGQLGSTPVFRTWDAWSGVHVHGEAIRPGKEYAIRCDFGAEGDPLLSPASWTTTAPWGDTVGDFLGDAWAPPDGAVGIMDLVAILDAFRALPSAPPLQNVDLIGVSHDGIDCMPDGVITTMDLVVAVDAFAGISFEESTGCPFVCP